MEIEVERLPALQKDAPSPVLLKLLDEKREIVGSVYVYPRWSEPMKPNHFQVEIHKGDTISPEIDIRLKI